MDGTRKRSASNKARQITARPSDRLPLAASAVAAGFAAAVADHPPGEKRERMIAVAAYYRAERRGFAPGCELEDWLAAEAEVEAQLGRRA